MKGTSNTVASNMIWRLFERFGAEIVAFIVSIILARLLLPEVYGIIALVTVFTTILQVFVEAGFSNALIQKKDADDVDFSTIFYFNIVVSIILYVLLFFLAPVIANFYDSDILVSVVRVLGLIVVIAGFKSIQQAYVSKHLLFKKFFFSTLSGTIISAFVGIMMAYNGFGIWALVAQYLSNNLIDTIILWITVKWKPSLVFSYERFKRLFAYGWKFLAASLLNQVYEELRSLIIGKRYSTTDLAYYNKGAQFPKLIGQNVNTSIDSVLLPVMSNVQNDSQKVKGMMRRSIKTGSFIMWPMMMGLAACARPMIELLLTDKWLGAVPFMQIFCITYAFYPIHTANLNAIKAIGRSDLYLKQEIAKKVLGIIVIVSTMWFGVFWIAIGGLLCSFINQIINSWPNKKLLNYSYLDQIKDVLPSLLLALFMASVVYCVNFLSLADWLTLIIQVPLGLLIYISGAYLFKFESFAYCLNIVKGFFQQKRTASKTNNSEEKAK